MKSNSRKTKALKGLMVGAVAFTPVLAIGVNVEKASAATIDDVAGKLASGYAGLDTDQRIVFDIVLENLNDYMGEFIQSDVPYKAALTTELKALVVPFKNTNETQLKTELTNRFNKFKEDAPDGLSDEGTIAELLVFIQNVTDDLVLEADTVNRNNLNEFYESLLTIINDGMNGAPQGVRDILQIPANPGLIIAEIQSDVNNAFNPVTPGPTLPSFEEPVDSGVIEGNPQVVIDRIEASKEPIDELLIGLAAGTNDVSIPGTIFNALEGNNPEALLVVSSAVGSYSLPVSAVNVQELAAQLGVASSELDINIKVVKVTTPTQVSNEFDIVLSSSIEFEVTVSANGKTVVLDVFPQPVQRNITATNPLDTLTTVGVTIVNGQVRSVPTFVENDKSGANLYRAGNSTYTLVKNFKTFKDVDKGVNWSEDNIEKLASRMIVNGTTATTFEPKRAITRGEFAAVLARGLGLVATDSTVKFKDVSPTQAVNKNGEIAAVYEAGIISGYNHEEFRPYQEINRGEAAIMISKALNYIGTDKVKYDKSKRVSNFKDYDKIGATMRPHIEKVLQAGYINGYSDKTYKSLNEANRAEVAKILYSFLNDIEFIN